MTQIPEWAAREQSGRTGLRWEIRLGLQKSLEPVRAAQQKTSKLACRKPRPEASYLGSSEAFFESTELTSAESFDLDQTLSAPELRLSCVKWPFVHNIGLVTECVAWVPRTRVPMKGI